VGLLPLRRQMPAKQSLFVIAVSAVVPAGIIGRRPVQMWLMSPLPKIMVWLGINHRTTRAAGFAKLADRASFTSRLAQITLGLPQVALTCPQG